MIAPRYTHIRSTSRSIDFDSQPALGADRRHADRARGLRQIAAALLLFWGGVMFALVWWLH